MQGRGSSREAAFGLGRLESPWIADYRVAIADRQSRLRFAALAASADGLQRALSCRGGNHVIVQVSAVREPINRCGLRLPPLGNPTNLHRSVTLTQKEFRFGFGNAVSEEESNVLYEKLTIPSPARPLFQAASANFVMHSQAKVNSANENRGPLLLISGLEDHTVPDVVTRSTLKQYRESAAVTELKQFEGRGHSLIIDSGWKSVADAILDWLKTKGMAGVRGSDGPSSTPPVPEPTS